MAENTTKVLETFWQKETDRYYYRLCEKEWAKGTFLSLDRMEMSTPLAGGDKVPVDVYGKTKMFTIPKDVDLQKEIGNAIVNLSNNGKEIKEKTGKK